MRFFSRFVDKRVDKELETKLIGLKEKIRKEIEEEIPESAAYLQGWEKTDAETGKATRVNYKTLESLYTRESWVRAAIDVVVRASTTSGHRLVAKDKRVDMAELEDKESVKELKQLFEHPNSENTIEEIIARIITDLHIYGDSYLEKVKDKKENKVKALFNIYAPSMRVLVDEHGLVQGYVQKTDGFGSSQPAFFEADEIVHFKLNNPGNEVYGLSPLESLFVPIESDLYAQAYNRDFFKNNATPRLHVDMGNCTYTQLKRNRHYWNSDIKGSGNSHKTIITEGGAKIQPIGTPPKDMEFLNQRKFSRDEILAVFGVPPIKVGIYEDANRANAKEQDKTFKVEKILPLQKYISQKITRSIIDTIEDCPVKFGFNPIDLRDAKDQADIDKIHLDNGLKTINELRKREGLDAVSWGDKPLINSRIVPLDVELEEKE